MDKLEHKSLDEQINALTVAITFYKGRLAANHIVACLHSTRDNLSLMKKIKG